MTMRVGDPALFLFGFGSGRVRLRVLRRLGDVFGQHVGDALLDEGAGAALLRVGIIAGERRRARLEHADMAAERVERGALVVQLDAAAMLAVDRHFDDGRGVVLGNFLVVAQRDAVFAPDREVADIGERDLGVFAHHFVAVDLEPPRPRRHAVRDRLGDLGLAQQNVTGAARITIAVAGTVRGLCRVEIDQIFVDEDSILRGHGGNIRGYESNATISLRRIGELYLI